MKKEKLKALLVLAAIYDAYNANELDDEARKYWGEKLENKNNKPFAEIILYTGRGGKTLLTLQDCYNAHCSLWG